MNNKNIRTYEKEQVLNQKFKEALDNLIEYKLKKHKSEKIKKGLVNNKKKSI